MCKIQTVYTAKYSPAAACHLIFTGYKILYITLPAISDAIAKEVFLSSPAVSARIERLEKRGILTGYHATVNPMLFGYHIKAFINLEVEPAQKKEFYPFIDRIPNVIECNCVTGDYAMLVEVMFQTTIQLDHFINELQHFGRTKTLIVFSTSVEHRDVPVN